MPSYEFRCGACGPFEERRDHRRAAEGASCPGCGAEARRVFGAPAVRSAYAMRLMTGVGAEGRDRIARAHTGEPKVVAAPPAGARITGGLTGPARVHHPHHGPSRPWQVGHC
jgi:putative FmdB family regulatory protein